MEKKLFLILLIGMSLFADGQNVPISQLPALPLDSAVNSDFYPVVHNGRYYKFTLGSTDSVIGCYATIDGAKGQIQYHGSGNYLSADTRFSVDSAHGIFNIKDVLGDSILTVYPGQYVGMGDVG